MSEYTGRVPKKGDRVGALGHNGVFTVVEVDPKVKTVELLLTNGSGPTVSSVPWTALTFLD